MHAALSADGVQFVNENDARCMAFSLLKQIAYPRRTHANKHFHKIAPADQKERHLGLPRDGPSKQRFTCTWRSDKKHTLWNAGTHSLILFRILEKVHDFLQFEFGFVAPRHILKGDAGIRIRYEASAALANGEKRLTRTTHSASKQVPKQDHDCDRQYPSQEKL